MIGLHVCAAAQLWIVLTCLTQSVAGRELHLTTLDIEVRPPRPVLDNDHRGFPAVVSVHQISRKRWQLWAAEQEVRVVERFHVVDLLGGLTRVGEYYTKIEIGGQSVRVQVDTGSSTLALPMAECATCLRADLRYNIRLSGAGRWVSCTNSLCRADMCAAHKCEHCSARDACCSNKNPAACGFQLLYGDKSYARGALVVDELSWGANLSAAVVFGGILDDSPHFERKSVDGILGMAYKALACNPTCVEPPFQQLVAAGKVADAFSICVAESAGKLVLGGFDDNLAAAPPSYVPLTLGEVPSFYSVNVSNELRIGERTLRLPYFRTAIVDSGTTLLVVRVVVFELLTEHLKRHYCHVRGICNTLGSWWRPAACVALPDSELKKMPTLRFLLMPNFVLELRPADYLIPYHGSSQPLRCVGIMSMPKMSHDSDVIFGNTVMQRYVTHYDRANKRLGFAIAKPGCGSPPNCRSFASCVECASQTGCSFDFNTAKCDSNIRGGGLIPYPKCAGSTCLCWLGPQTALLFGSMAGFIGTVVLFALAVLLMALYGRRDRTNNSRYSLADDADEAVDVALVESETEDVPLKRIEKDHGLGIVT